MIRESPSLFIKMYAISLGTFFLSDGYRLLWYEMSGGAITLPNITRAIATGKTDIIWEYLRSEPLQASAFLFGFLFWAATFLLALIGTARGLLRGERSLQLAVLASVVIVAYFALLTGPVAQARYRIVVTPFLFMLASYGVTIVGSYLHAKRKKT